MAISFFNKWFNKSKNIDNNNQNSGKNNDDLISNKNDELIKIVDKSYVRFIDVHRLGFADCNQTKGDLITLESSFDKLKSGKIIDIKSDHESMLENQKGKVDNLIENVKRDISTINAALNNLQNIDIPDKQRKISETKNKIQEVENKLQLELNNVDVIKKRILFGLTIMSLLWIYFFYLNTFYTGLVKDWQLYYQNTPNANFQMFTLEALGTFGFHWFIPLGIFSVLGLIWLFKTKDKKHLFLLVIGIGLLVDFAIAYMINAAHNEFIRRLGDSEIIFYLDVNFYIVLILGFGSQLALTFTASEYVDLANSDSIKKKAQIEKTQFEQTIENVLTPALNDLKKEAESKKSELEYLKSKLSQLETLQPTEFVIDNKQIEYLVNTYYNGWVIAFSNFMWSKEEMEIKRNAFENIKIEALKTIYNEK